MSAADQKEERVASWGGFDVEEELVAEELPVPTAEDMKLSPRAFHRKMCSGQEVAGHAGFYSCT